MRKPHRYAEGTQIAVEKTRAEIERLVKNHGATSFGSLSSTGSATILFEINGRRIRFELPVPEIRDLRQREAEERRRWRCLLLSIKAKFETVANGIVAFDEEFLANIVVPGSGETVGAWLAPQLANAYERGIKMPPLLAQ